LAHWLCHKRWICKATYLEKPCIQLQTKGHQTYSFGYISYIQPLFSLLFAWTSPCTCVDIQVLWFSGRLSYIHRPKWGTLAHGQKGRHLRCLTKNGRLQSKDSHFWVSQPRIILNNEQCESYPNCLSWGCHHKASSCTSFSSLQLGAGASSWKHPAIHGVLIVLFWRGSFRIRLRWTRKDRRFLRARGNKLVIDPRQESRFRRLEPIKNRKGQKKKLRWDSRRKNTKWAWGEQDLPEALSLGSPFEDWSLKG
jgi:hypothetical protein